MFAESREHAHATAHCIARRQGLGTGKGCRLAASATWAHDPDSIANRHWIADADGDAVSGKAHLATGTETVRALPSRVAVRHALVHPDGEAMSRSRRHAVALGHRCGLAGTASCRS